MKQLLEMIIIQHIFNVIYHSIEDRIYAHICIYIVDMKNIKLLITYNNYIIYICIYFSASL